MQHERQHESSDSFLLEGGRLVFRGTPVSLILPISVTLCLALSDSHTLICAGWGMHGRLHDQNGLL